MSEMTWQYRGRLMGRVVVITSIGVRARNPAVYSSPVTDEASISCPATDMNAQSGRCRVSLMKRFQKRMLDTVFSCC